MTCMHHHHNRPIDWSIRVPGKSRPTIKLRYNLWTLKVFQLEWVLICNCCLMFIAHCLYLVVFSVQLFKSMCHPNYCIHHLLPSDRKAKQNDKNQKFLNTILMTGVSRKLMASLVWWLLLQVPWSAWTVGACHGLSPFGSVFGHWCRISQIFATPLQNVINLSSCKPVVPNDALPRPLNNNVFNSRSSGILQICPNSWSFLIRIVSTTVYFCCTTSYLFISSSILPFHCQNTYVIPHLKSN